MNLKNDGGICRLNIHETINDEIKKDMK